MSRSRFTVHLLLGGMIVVPLFYLYQSTSDAAVAAAPFFRSDLIFHPALDYPAFEQIKKIEQPLIATYVTQKNDTFWQLSKKMNFSREDNDTVRSSNGLDFGSFSEGTVLKLPNQHGTLYEVSTPEDLASICNGYQYYRTLGRAAQEMVLAVNQFPMPDLRDPDHKFASGTTLFLPRVLKPFGFPLPIFGRITSRVGWRRHPILGIRRRHNGTDIAKPYGTNVPAAVKGVVIFAGWAGGYGNMVKIHTVKHRGGKSLGYYTIYGHLSAILVHEGQSVGSATIIGRVGSTGISTGPHLHYEIRDENDRVLIPQ